METPDERRLRYNRYARECQQRRRAAHKDLILNDNLRQLYGITLEDYKALLAKQLGFCAICRDIPIRRRLEVDHDHTKAKGERGFIRGLLCHWCNVRVDQSHENGWAEGIAYLNIDRS